MSVCIHSSLTQSAPEHKKSRFAVHLFVLIFSHGWVVSNSLQSGLCCLVNVCQVGIQTSFFMMCSQCVSTQAVSAFHSLPVYASLCLGLPLGKVVPCPSVSKLLQGTCTKKWTWHLCEWWKTTDVPWALGLNSAMAEGAVPCVGKIFSWRLLWLQYSH